MTKKLETFTSTSPHGTKITVIDQTNILTHEVNSVLELQKMITRMVKETKETELTKQKAFANSEVQRLSNWMKDTMDWDAEKAIREIARSEW